jgi:spore coat polysaccharide biosynthesis protein SpsF
MGSTRRPGKVLADLAGRPMLYHVVKRSQQARGLDLVVVATSDREKDDAIEQYCNEIDVPCFRGSEDDVLDRYVKAARKFDADRIARLTADCPLLDPKIIDKVITTFDTAECDYVSNFLVPTYPDGLDNEICSREVLEQAWRDARLKTEREYVTVYIWKRPEVFRLLNVKHDKDLSHLRWTVDEPEDLELVREIYKHLGPEPNFGMEQILALLEEHPELNEINARFTRNEGYQKSLMEDAIVK